MSAPQKLTKRTLPFPRDGRNIKTRATAQAGSGKRHFYKPLPKEPSVCYETIRVKRREGFEIGGRWIPPAEVYSNSEAWGVDGFTVTDKEAAFAKLREISK